LSAPPIAVGTVEDERTELKDARALRNLEVVSRGVVAMLNASGGSVWIGVEERDERAIGFQPIPSIERERRRVEDHLTAAIEPPPLGGDVRVETAEVTPGTSILVIRVEPSGRGPHAQLHGAGRHYVVRAGARCRPMTHTELIRAFQLAEADSDRLRRESDEAWQREAGDALASGRKELWVRISFQPPLAVPRSLETQQLLTRWLRDPSETGNREMGWNFTSAYESFRPLPGNDGRPDGFIAGGPDEDTWTEVRTTGETTFRASLARLEWTEAAVLYPYALVELPASVIRLAAKLHAELGGRPDDRVLADIGLIGVQGMKIRPGTPRSIAYELHEPRSIDAETVRPEPHEEPARMLAQAPDAFAWRALTALYFRLGLMEDRMPVGLYDEQHQRLRLPT
jgi:hypothetical protein